MAEVVWHLYVMYDDDLNIWWCSQIFNIPNEPNIDGCIVSHQCKLYSVLHSIYFQLVNYFIFWICPTFLANDMDTFCSKFNIRGTAEHLSAHDCHVMLRNIWNGQHINSMLPPEIVFLYAPNKCLPGILILYDWPKLIIY